MHYRVLSDEPYASMLLVNGKGLQEIAGGTGGGSQTLFGNFEEKLSYTRHKLNPDSSAVQRNT
jgi:ATP-dependent protease HslVU (ClpYQ) peptidase subunit